ncbi:MAG: hypothetical protein EOO03_13095, partial [Chitinophagaceae bacterium]
VLAYLREKSGRKAVVIFNFSNRVQDFKVNDIELRGKPLNVFRGEEEKISDDFNFSLEPWGYIVYDYK